MNTSALSGDSTRNSTEITHDVDGQQRRFQPGGLDLPSQHRADARDAQHHRLGQQQREEQERLILGHPLQHTAFGPGLLGAERERGDLDVRILVLVVRVGVVAGVFAHPPLVADPGDDTVRVPDKALPRQGPKICRCPAS
jgi:hypothetical protein